ncbi:MAG: MlaD family protein [Pseudomonadota bacterium]
MSDTVPGPRENLGSDSPPKALIKPRSKFPVVWLVPLVAAAIAAWLVLDTVTSRGPEITILFEDGIGIKDDADIRYRGVKVGTVTSIGLNDDLTKVVVTARLKASARNLAEEGSKFWIVRPEISLTRVSGLSTIASGSYLAAEPDPSTNKKATQFVGLKTAPIAEVDDKSLIIELHSPTLASVRPGDPVLFREVTVGKITQARLNDDGTNVKIFASISPKYAHLVREHTVFWNASGVDFNLKDLFNASVDFQSVEAILAGGVAFANPPDPGDTVKNGTNFRLHPDQPTELLLQINHPPGLVILLFAEKLGAISTGDPIYYREFEVGTIQDIRLAQNAATVEIRALIYPSYQDLIRDNTVFWNASGLDAHFGIFSGVSIDVESLRSLVGGGIALATPPKDGNPVNAGHRFNLYPKPQEEWHNWAPQITLPATDYDQISPSANEGSTSASGSGSAGTAQAADDGEASDSANVAPEAANVAPAAPPIPTAITLPASNLGPSTETLRDHLIDLGFSDIEKIDKKGNYFYVTAYWLDQEVSLEVDAKAGKIRQLKESN